jgi:curli production assembly/transport component CsgE
MIHQKTHNIPCIFLLNNMYEHNFINTEKQSKQTDTVTYKFNVMRFDLMSILLLISTSFLISLNAQTETGEDTLKLIQNQQIQQALDPLDLEIDEIIFDETITKVGRDFYDLFYTSWSNPTQISDFSITVKEMPMPGIGTQITVLIDDFEILKQFIRPNQEMIEMLAAYTVDLATQFLLNYQEIQAQLQNEDQAGTGIF